MGKAGIVFHNLTNHFFTRKIINTMKTILFFACLIALFYSCCPKYFSGEGNKIPTRAVKMLVRDQFVILPANEIDTLNKYFPKD